MDACHITPHKDSGINGTTNALLLRADIHDLFDSYLIGINPETLRVEIHSSLNGTEHEKLNGVQLNNRLDNKIPDIQALTARWNLFMERSN